MKRESGRRSSVSQRFAGFAALLLLNETAEARGGNDWGNGFLSLSNAVVVLYAEGNLQPEAVITIGGARRVHQRRGFYRIGLLPALLVEDVAVEVRHPETAQDALRATQARWKAMGGTAAVELRRIELVFADPAKTKLRAESLVLDSGGVWRLRGHVRLESNQAAFETDRAELTVVGREAGRLDCATDHGPRTFQLFQPNSANSSPSTPSPP